MYFNIIGVRMDDNSKRAIEDNNVTGATENDIMGVIDDGVMGHVEDGDSMRACDYLSIVAIGSYNDMGMMLNDSTV